MDWRECEAKRLAKQVATDNQLIHSLLNSSDKKAESEKRLQLDEITASTKISIAYEALREIMEALAIQKGFKIYNHECYTSFCKEQLNEDAIADEYDTYRKIRNAINYYGEDVSQEDAQQILQGINNLRQKILEKYWRNNGKNTT